MKFLRCLAVIGLCLGGPAQLLADPLKTLSKQLAKGMTGLPGHHIAVLPFQYPDGATSSGSTLVAERLIACLSQRRDLQIVERSLLSKLLEEMKMEVSGVTPAAMQKWGKILAVDGIVTGTLVDLGNGRTEVHARLVALENGVILAARSVIIRRTWADMPSMPTTAPVPLL